MGSNKVFVIGLDGGAYDLVHPWVKRGLLPAFKRLMTEGIGGNLTVELPPGTVPNWPSFMTGRNAGKHGVIHWFTHHHDFSDWSIISSRSIKEKPFWEVLGDYGKKSIIMNVPVTYPPTPLNGLMITGLLTPASADNFTYPSELRSEIEAKVGKYTVYPGEIYGDGKEEKFLASLMESMDMRFKTSLYLMDRYAWDVFTLVFSETDMIQHAFWKFTDPKHPQYNEKLAALYHDGIFKVYEKIDHLLSEYMKILDKNTTILLMSDHGGAPFYEKFYTNNWLRKQGFLTLKKSPWSLVKYSLFKCGFTMQNLYKFVMKTGLVNWIKFAARNESAEGLIRQTFLSYKDIDWDKTAAFAFGGFGQIYLKKDLSDGRSFETLRDTIIERLEEVRIPSGGPFIDRIYKKEELYTGPNADAFPDIVFIPTTGYVDPGDFEFFSNRIFDDAVGGSGTHSPFGLFLIWGNNVKTGGTFRGARIHDIAPTLLYLTDTPVPSDMDGRVLVETLNEAWVDQHPVLYTSSESEVAHERPTYDKEEEEEIKKRLKGLGYIG